MAVLRLAGFRRCGRSSWGGSVGSVAGSHVGAVAGRGLRNVGEEMADEGEQGLDARAGDARVTADDRDLRVEVDGGTHLVGVVTVGTVELVDRYDEGESAL